MTADISGPSCLERRTLYSPAELLAGFVADDPSSLARTFDARVQAFARVSRDRLGLHGEQRALHDHRIGVALRELAARHPQTVALMGGHRIHRGSDDYWRAARIARLLAKHGVLVATGGGPGAMEAAHIGAALSERDLRDTDRVIAELAHEPQLPPASGADAELHRWYRLAVEAAISLGPVEPSLAVPTWHLDAEPFTPFASHIAKIFDNALREDLLLDIGAGGIVVAPGKAGTVWEIFQMVWKNYYGQFGERIAPMVFLGVRYWTQDIPVLAVIERLFADAPRASRLRESVLVTDDEDQACAFLLNQRHRPA